MQEIKNFFILINNKYKLKMIINIISIIILINFLILIIGTLKDVFIYSFYYHLDYGHQIKVLDNNLYCHSLLFYTPIFLALFAIIKRKIGILEFTISIILASMAVKYNFFDTLHNLIKDTIIFDKLKEEGRTIINNQYTRIILYIVLIMTLFIQTLIKRTRTLSRIIICFVVTSCLITVTVFHIAIPMGMFKSVLEEKKESQRYEIENYSKEDLCKNKNCYYLYENGKIEVIYENLQINDFKKYSWAISQGIFLMKNNNKNTFSENVSVNEGFLFDYDILVMKKENEKYFTIIDNSSMRKYSRESEIMFSFLAIMAHLIWIFGSLVLLEFHYYKFKNRLKNKSNEVNK